MPNETENMGEGNALRITAPGKFEGEPRYAPYFYDAMLNGGSDESFYREWEGQPGESDDLVADLFRVISDDVEKFPELENVGYVTLKYDSAGFVFAEPHATKTEAVECLKAWLS